jgi:prepilin-type processing-associated H-X9-DG protein
MKTTKEDILTGIKNAIAQGATETRNEVDQDILSTEIEKVLNGPSNGGKKDILQPTLNNIEIEGLIAMFNEFYRDYCEQCGAEQARANFFYCDGHLQSEDIANGTPILFEGFEISHLAKRKDGDLTYVILEDNKGNERLCEFNQYNGAWHLFDKTWSKVVKSGKCW